MCGEGEYSNGCSIMVLHGRKCVCVYMCVCVCTVSPFSDFILSVHMSSHEVEGVPSLPSLDAVVTVELVGGSGPTITFP